ncbi:Uncharacterized protein SCF082_LOCUS1517 [Durusdinium trenchii]|uniref:Uncharacterized protein n=1 Tax=Durusdinium trenchii TaxID=1381693 RepID=A0ABP0HF94_9DINO
MALSMRFLAKASQSFESIVTHAPSPKAMRTPKTPMSPKTPALSSFTMASPLNSPQLLGLHFFPEEVEKRSSLGSTLQRAKVHFADEQTGPALGNLSRLLGGRLRQPEEESSSPVDAATAASSTRVAVLARLSRKEARDAPVQLAPMKPTLPMLLGRGASLNPTRSKAVEVVDAESCAFAARKAFLEQLESRASRSMVDFVV